MDNFEPIPEGYSAVRGLIEKHYVKPSTLNDLDKIIFTIQGFNYPLETINRVLKDLGVEREKFEEKEEPKTESRKYDLERYKSEIRKWLYIGDGEILDIVLAGMIAEKVGGDPLWLFLIAPPGGSKTELLRSFNNPDYFHHLSDMTSKTLITGLMVSEEKEDD